MSRTFLRCFRDVDMVFHFLFLWAPLILLLCILLPPTSRNIVSTASVEPAVTKDQNAGSSAPSTRPHIIFFLADDLGFNDVSFRGSNQIPTPNIDALAYGGVILNRYYVAPVCSPTRAAIFTGRHPIHIGMQHRVLYGAEPRGLPLSEILLPQYLRRLGYSTHLLGKWHLGFFKREYTPTFRGFDSHLGFWSGHHDYFDHTAVETPYWGLDMRRGLEAAWDLHGVYSTSVFTQEAERIIAMHNKSQPLFLMVAHAAVHSGNPYSPLPAPDETVARFDDISDFSRRRFAAMLSELDSSLGRIVEALRCSDMLDKSIIIFSTDNGGPAAGFNLNAASNWPLRGVKNTLWEGGVRGAGVLWAAHLQRPGRFWPHLFHATDWLPTLYHAAGGDPGDLGPLDGIDAWEALMDGGSAVVAPRDMVLHNIDDIFGNAALTVGDWKVMQGSTYGGNWDDWYGPSGREKPQPPYDVGQVLGSRVGRALQALGRPLSAQRARDLRLAAEVHCPVEQLNSHAPHYRSNESSESCHPLVAPCLFNVRDDPCERNNLAKRFPLLLQHLQALLAAVNATAVPSANLPLEPRADPRFWDHTWINFGDYTLLDNAVS